MAAAISREAELRRDYLHDEQVTSIYLGGGTPSLFSASLLSPILTKLRTLFSVSSDAEITLEANPDDLSSDRLSEYRAIGVNRLSLGVQTFDAEVLKYLNRTHNAKQARASLDIIRRSGIDNFSVDLIYGIPQSSKDAVEHDLDILISEQLPHVSSYCLTIEPKTVFGKWQEKGKLHESGEDRQVQEFELISEKLKAAGLLHYEVSNYGRPGKLAVHNTSYWHGSPYLGLGPGAHSYNKESRQYNIRNNAKYLKAISNDEVPMEIEHLSYADKVNEIILTSMRTMWGIDRSRLLSIGYDIADKGSSEITAMANEGYLEPGTLILTPKGLLLADGLAAQLFI